ncbi:succinate receptor 1-like [Morone saxatilis]|uniref:succinate receptor 1-like n=1 Tax=Morone saxatilis TaxID=34816 RepID=UPI0015E219B6|nr:succinate receptor 1-like [Morone saxatilis]
MVDFHGGGLNGMDGERGLTGGQSRRWREGGRCQWMALAVLAVLGLLVWLATPADMDRHGGRSGFSGAKQPKGQAAPVQGHTSYSRYQRLLDDSYSMVQNCTEIDDVLQKYYLSPSYGIEFCIGFPGNLLVVLGYIFCLPKWQSCNIYLFNLAVSDLIFLCTLPRLSYLYANDQSETNPFACVINRYILHVNLYSSILFMVWLSMDRFLLIRHPTRNHYLLRPRTALIVTGLSWLAVNVEVAPMIALMVHDLQGTNWSLCNDFASLEGEINNFGYSLGLTFTGYILPLLGLCGFSHQIAHLLRVQERALQRRTSFKRPLRVVASAAAMFLFLYTPYHVLRNVSIASMQRWAGLPLCTKMYIKGLYILTRPVAFLHSVINPVFYFLMGDKFRELVFAKLRTLVRKTEQQSTPA